MMHQNELRGHSGNERQNEDGSVTGSGNRNTDRSERSEFYNEWDGGGAGGGHRATGGGQATAGHKGRGPKGYQRSDERIRDDVHRELTDDDSLDASEIEVTVSGGEVTLTGTVSSRADKRRAEMVLDSIHGVSDVHNQIRVARAD